VATVVNSDDVNEVAERMKEGLAKKVGIEVKRKNKRMILLIDV
jgi:hypothetical protein